MANKTYNLTQTGAEVQAIIDDANGVKDAGATTSLTTDYIMLKDTSGAYHKIQKSSFTEAVRNTIASLLVNNDKGTTISQIAAIASGDFGSVTPANLASVLGVLPVVASLRENVNFNDLLSSYDEGRYFIKFDYNTVPAWAGITAGYNETVVTRQGPTNWFIEIKESDFLLYTLRIIYSRQASSIKIAFKIPATKLTIT